MVVLQPQTKLEHQRGPLLMIYPVPPELNLGVGGTGTVRVWIRNYGDQPAINSTLYVHGSRDVNMTADGIHWGSNLTVKVGVVPQGKDVVQVLFVRLNSARNASVTLILISDNADPAVAYFSVYYLKPGGGEYTEYVPWVLAILGAGLALLLVVKIRPSRKNA
ncbi:hypothetical protein IG193_03040 [Infirmifilum lucidum]|uniref:CARDB domain-containing protein n=1 Tax=Infirmifilum lucidum TaxID=2776706 RepID=A0A7L9FIJ5_9CREN|nr:hypothetical protein [Infirmifilum lucidum]QOJ79451.1 hypothetical protein IG193_03040 [Infirmifilum lucidum]